MRRENMSIVDNIKLEERAWKNRVCAVCDGEAVLILIAAEGQVAVYGVCLPSTSMIRPVVFLGAPTTQGTRCGARRKDGDGYGSLTIDRDNTRFLALTSPQIAFTLDKVPTLVL